MVNTQLLDAKIDSSGMKISHIVDTIGISRQAFDKKKKNCIKFRVAEIYVLCDLLKINDPQEKTNIFFAHDVER